MLKDVVSSGAAGTSSESSSISEEDLSVFNCFVLTLSHESMDLHKYTMSN